MIAIGADHGGFFLKEELIKIFEGEIIFKDFGTISQESVNYPEIAFEVAEFFPVAKSSMIVFHSLTSTISNLSFDNKSLASRESPDPDQIRQLYSYINLSQRIIAFFCNSFTFACPLAGFPKSIQLL